VPFLPPVRRAVNPRGEGRFRGFDVRAEMDRSDGVTEAAAGFSARVGPVAIANGRSRNRNHGIYRRFSLQSCKVDAKTFPLITHLPDALAHGTEIRIVAGAHTGITEPGRL